MSARVVYLGRYGTYCGLSTYTEQLADAVNCRGNQVSVVTSDHALTSECERDGVSGDILSVVGWEEKGSVESAFDRLIDDQPDVVHIQHEFGIFTDPCALLDLCNRVRKAAPSTKFVITVHTVRPSFSGSGNGFLMLLRGMDAVIVHSEKCAAITRDYPAGEDIPRVSVIPHGMLPPCERIARVEAEETLGLKPNSDRFTLLALGFLAQSKKQLLLIQQIALIIKKRIVEPRRIHLIIAGMPPVGQDSRYAKQSILGMIESMGLLRQVSLFFEFVPFERLPVFYGASDVAIHMGDATSYSSSGSIRMDLSFGMPVLAKRSPLTHDLPSDVVRLFNDDAELVYALKPLSSRHTDTLTKMSEKGTEMALAHSWPKTAEKHEDLYHALVGRVRRSITPP